MAKSNRPTTASGPKYRRSVIIDYVDRIVEFRELQDGTLYNYTSGDYDRFGNTIDDKVSEALRSGYKVVLFTGEQTEARDRGEKEEGSTRRMMSALVRTPEGNLRVVRYDDYRSKSAFGADLRGNGYRVLHIWNGYIGDAEADEWELFNRK